MWQRIVAWFKGLFGEPKQLSALEAMDAIQRDKLPAADADAWKRKVSTFKSAVFSERDRQRLWRSHRRGYDHAAAEWPPASPNQHDQACLDDILHALQR